MKRTRSSESEPPREQPPWSQCYCGGAGPRISVMMGGMCQGPVFDHFRNAGVEVLKGLRAIIDEQIEMMTRQEKKGTKVPVE